MHHPNLVDTHISKGKNPALVASLIALVVIVIGYMSARLYSDWWMMGVFFFVAALLGIFTYVFYRTEPSDMYRCKLRSDGIFQEWKEADSNQTTERLMPFTEMDFIVIGLCEERIVCPSRKHIYRHKGLLVMRWQGEYFFKSFANPMEWRVWKEILDEKGLLIHYTTKNIEKAFLAQAYMEIDFSLVPSSTDDHMSSYIGIETYTPLLETWKPAGVEEVLLHAQKDQEIPRTRKAENWVMGILFLYNVACALIIFPVAPIDSGGFVELTGNVLTGCILGNVLLPVAFVFWRSFTRWYLPLLFTVVTFAGNTLGVLLALWIEDFSFAWTSLLLLHALTLVLWVVAMINIKLLKLIRIFLHDWEFGK